MDTREIYLFFYRFIFLPMIYVYVVICMYIYIYIHTHVYRVWIISDLLYLHMVLIVIMHYLYVLCPVLLSYGGLCLYFYNFFRNTVAVNIHVTIRLCRYNVFGVSRRIIIFHFLFWLVVFFILFLMYIWIGIKFL